MFDGNLLAPESAGMFTRSSFARTLVMVGLLIALGVFVRYGIVAQLNDRHPEVRAVRDAPHVKIERKPKQLEIGDTAPDFAVPGEAGKIVQLADYRGKWVVLLFSRAHW